MSDFGFSTALSALTAARLALQTIGHNVANANTAGYNRQRVILSPNVPIAFNPRFAVGNGVRVGSIDQVVEPLLAARLRSQTQAVGHGQAQYEVLTDLDAALGEPGDGGLNGLLSGFFNGLENLRQSPSDAAARTSALEHAVSLANGFRAARSGIAGVRTNVTEAIRIDVGRLNKTLEEIHRVNRSILTAGFGGAVPPDLANRQEQLVAEVAKLVDVRVSTAPTGQISVIAGGQALVTPNGFNAVKVMAVQSPGAPSRLRAGSGSVDFVPASGRLAGLLELEPAVAGDALDVLDGLAARLIRSVNHAHATGIPAGGGFTDLASSSPFRDQDGDGSVMDERLTAAGLPFEVTDGTLTVNVRSTASGETRQVRIPIVAGLTTVANLRDALDGIEHLDATVDSAGRLRIRSEAGFQFDFAARPNPTPDLSGTFGGARPTLVAPTTFPTAITPGSSMQIAVDGNPPQTITFSAGQFADPNAATAAEVAAAINSQLVGGAASVVNGRLVLQGNTDGPQGTLSLNGGAPIAGQANAVAVAVSGAYTGGEDQSYVLAPLGDGVIGQTAGLAVEVRRTDGTLVGTLDVGLGYSPGTPLALAEGLSVSFGGGAVSATAGHFVQVDAIADGDTAGILAAAQINPFFTGSDAETIALAGELRQTPSLLAHGLGGGASDAANVARMLAVRDARYAELDDRSIVERFDLLVADSGFGAERAATTLETQRLLLDQLENRRQSISGVDIDEELLLLEQFQRSYEVAARFTQTLSQVNDVLMSLAR